MRRGLGDRIPDDAAMVMIIGPQRAFLEAERNAIREYLDRGGSLLVALEPGSDFRLEEFRDQLGVDHDPAMTINDDRHLRLTGAVSERRNIFTNRFSAHASVTTASRQGVTQGIALFGPGPRQRGRGRGGAAHQPDHQHGPVKLPGQERQLPLRRGDGGEGELRRCGGGRAGGGGRPRHARPRLRDAEIFSDEVLVALQLNAFLVADGIRWLGREELFSGEVVSEEDVPILHTRSENVVWFYAIIFRRACAGAGPWADRPLRPPVEGSRE